MKKFILFLVLSVIAIPSAEAQSDKDLVKQTLNYYLDGGTNNDFETLKKAFHENATMKYIKGEEYTEVNAVNFFKGIMKPGPKQDRETRITHMDIMGTAAHARIEIIYKDFAFIDYMNLLKVDGEWKIVSKIFYRDNRK